MIIDRAANPPRLNSAYVRDEGEQVRYMRELLEIFEEEGVDSAIWLTFAGQTLPHHVDPHFDLDMASFGVVNILEDNESSAYPGMGGAPKASFDSLAAAYARCVESFAAATPADAGTRYSGHPFLHEVVVISSYSMQGRPGYPLVRSLSYVRNWASGGSAVFITIWYLRVQSLPVRQALSLSKGCSTSGPRLSCSSLPATSCGAA